MRCTAKRSLATLLAALLLGSFCACGTPAEETPETAAPTGPAATEAETENTDYVCDLDEELDFGGEEVTIMYVKVAGRDDELISPELGNGIISDAVYERNLAVENQLNVTMAYVDQSGDAAAQSAIQTAVKGGDRSMDLFVIGTHCCVDPALSGCYLNLNAVENIDLSKHYWTQDFNTMMTLTADKKQFTASSPAALSLFRLTYLTIFNRELFEDRKIPDLYETVENGEWTLDYQYSLAADAWVDTDGDGKASRDDFYGFITGTCISVDAYCVSSNIHLVVTDEDGYLAYDSRQAENMVTMAEKVSLLYNAAGTYTFKGQTEDDIGKHYIMEKFSEQQGLMATTQFLSIEVNIEPLKEFDYGIVPMPKLTVEQADYHTYVQDQVSSFGISAAIGNEDRQAMLGAVMEAMAYHSYVIVRPAYYDSALSLRFMQDPQSKDILDTMFETIAFDYCYATGVGSVRNDMRAVLSSPNPAIASRIKSWERSLQRLLDRNNEQLDKLDS